MRLSLISEGLSPADARALKDVIQNAQGDLVINARGQKFVVPHSDYGALGRLTPSVGGTHSHDILLDNGSTIAMDLVDGVFDRQTKKLLWARPGLRQRQAQPQPTQPAAPAAEKPWWQE